MTSLSPRSVFSPAHLKQILAVAEMYKVRKENIGIDRIFDLDGDTFI